PAGAGTGQDAAPSAGLPAGTPAAPAGGAVTADTSGESAPPARAAEPIVVRSPLYTYTLSTQGGRITAATLHEYRSTILSDSSAPVQIVKPEGGLLALRLVAGGDTIPLDRWIFTPSATSLVVDSAPASLTLSGSEGGVGVELTYTFTPEYHVAVAGRASGMGPDRGLVLVDLGRGVRNTEADSGQNFNAYAAIVSDADGTERTDFRSLAAGETEVLSGPFEWAAVKSKYFVASVFAFDSMGARGRISGVRATAAPVEPRHKNDVHVVASMPVPASGLLSYAVYLGP